MLWFVCRFKGHYKDTEMIGYWDIFPNEQVQGVASIVGGASQDD